MADVDGNDDLDIIITTLGKGNTVYKNNGKEKFYEDNKIEYRKDIGFTKIYVGNIDGGGDLKVLISKYKPRGAKDKHKKGENYSGQHLGKIELRGAVQREAQRRF